MKKLEKLESIVDASKHITFLNNEELKNYTLAPFSTDRTYGNSLSNKVDFLQYQEEMCAKYMDANKNAKNLEVDMIENGFQDSKGGRPTVVPFYMYFFAEYERICEVYYDRMWNAADKKIRKANREVKVLQLIAKCVKVYQREDISFEEKVKQVKIITLKNKENKKLFVLNKEQGLYVEKEKPENDFTINLDEMDMLSVPVSGITRYCIFLLHGLKGQIAFTKENYQTNPFGAKATSIFNDSTIPAEERCELIKCYIDFLYGYYNWGTAKSAPTEVVARQTSRNFRKLLEMTENYSFAGDLNKNWPTMTMYEKLIFIIEKWFDGRKHYVKTLKENLKRDFQNILKDNVELEGLGKENAVTFANAFDTLLISSSKDMSVTKEDIAEDIGISIYTLKVVDLEKTKRVAKFFTEMKVLNGGDVSYVKTDMVQNYLRKGKTVQDYLNDGLRVFSKKSKENNYDYITVKEQATNLCEEKRIELVDSLLETLDKEIQKKLISKFSKENFSFFERATVLCKGGE